MVKELNLALVFAGIVCVVAALACGVPLTADSLLPSPSPSLPPPPPQSQPSQVNATRAASATSAAADDGTVRSERSTNLSHITGSARKIRMYVKNRHLQLLPDGTVNGTSDDTSDYSEYPHIHLQSSHFYQMSNCISSNEYIPTAKYDISIKHVLREFNPMNINVERSSTNLNYLNFLFLASKSFYQFR